MRYAQFYALAIFFMYMIFFFRIIWRRQGNMSQDKDIDCLPGC